MVDRLSWVVVDWGIGWGTMRSSAKLGNAMLLIVACLIQPSSIRPEPLGNPLPGRLCPTSSFGSWRSGHLHAGMDLSTGGKTDVPVLAVDSCWVWRIRVWNGGYGKALYVRLADGMIAVYGHLSRYTPEIDALVEREQDLRGSYEVEIYSEPKVFRFSRGDTIAFSGDTGSGPAHLHFELRSGTHDHSSINPVPGYVDVSEIMCPDIEAVAVTPLSPGCDVNGAYGPVVIAGPAIGDTLRISGEFGVSAKAVDIVQCGRSLTPTRYEARLDDTAIWHLNLDRFPFSKSHFVGSLYHNVSGTRFVRLFDPYGLDLRGFTCSARHESPFLAGLDRGLHHLKIVAADAWGNADSVTIPFYYGDRPEFASFGLAEDSLGLMVQVTPRPADCGVEVLYRARGAGWDGIDLSRQGGVWCGRIGAPRSAGMEVLCKLTGSDGFTSECVLSPWSSEEMADSVAIDIRLHADFLEVHARSTGPPRSLPTAYIFEGSRLKKAVLQPAGRNVFRTAYVPEEPDRVIHVRVEAEFAGRRVQATEGLALGRVMPGGRVWLLGDRFKVRLAAPENYSASTLVTLREDGGTAMSGFTGTLGRIVLGPDDTFFDERIEILLVSRDSGLTTKYGVFAEHLSKPLFLGRFDSTGTCTVKLHRLETMVVLEDSVPPVIEWIDGLVRRPADGKGLFSALIGDEASGIDWDSLRAYVDGDIAIVTYDPDTSVVSGRSRKPLQYGTHRIRLEARDRIGNSATEEMVAELTR